jgi:hypothetical protein
MKKCHVSVGNIYPKAHPPLILSCPRKLKKMTVRILYPKHEPNERCHTSATSGEYAMNLLPHFPFICVIRRLKYPVFLPPHALMNEKSASYIHSIFAGCCTSQIKLEGRKKESKTLK